MKNVDPIKELSERKLTIAEFVTFYNKNLPESFPRASESHLLEFQKTYPAMFKKENEWSLDQHRKKFMDWLPQHIRSLAQES